MKARELIAPTLVVGLAAGLRFYRLDWAEFKLDEARLAALALGLARDGRLPRWGIDASIGVPNFPLAAWLAAVPFAFSADPVAATGFVALLNTLAALGVYLVGRAWYGLAGGLIAGLLYAASPWAVLFSRKLWPPEFLAPFAVAFVYTAYRGFAAGSGRVQAAWFFLTGLLLAAMVQIQYAALSLLVSAAVWFGALRRRLRPAGLAGFAAGLAGPFLAFLAVDPPQTLAVGRAVLGLAGRPAETDLKVLESLWVLATGRAIHSLAGPDRFMELLGQVGDAGPAQTLTGLWVLAGIAGQAAALGRSRTDRANGWRTFIPLGCVLGPVLVQLRHPLDVHLEYLLCALPALYLLAGSTSALAARLPGYRLTGPALVTLAVVLAAPQAGRVRQAVEFLGTQATPGAYGVPLQAHLTVAAEARRLYAGLPAAEVWLLGPGSNPAYDEYPAVYSVLLGRELPLRFYDATRPVPWPNYSGLIVALPGTVPPAGAQGVGSPVPWRRGEGTVGFWLWTGGGPTRPAVAFDPAPVWADGVRLLGAAAPACVEAERPARLYLYWDTGMLSRPFQVFNHLIGPDGSRAAQADGPGPPPVPGRTVVNWFDIKVPPGAPHILRLVSGRYLLPAVEAIPRADTGRPEVTVTELRVGCG